jgi:hypothetical protein
MVGVKGADMLYMPLEVFAFEAIWLVDDIWLVKLLNHRRCPIDHHGIFTSCKFQMEERTFKRTSIIVWADSSHHAVNFIVDGGGKGEDEPPPERKLANDRDPFVENTTTLI